ncbi:alkaline phosphatase [Sinomonas atrocyanea]|uniref:Alkaline phosphatase n=1 Tax=Sinomonas atrocyanea TaxID=37927 RepID=A0A126ZYT2_9MICC|nr:VTT domain-containing protein [Sinomonas atrocyanea]AMM32253.1 alkaline phosphatase [Sinomonas atrocyanea]GEB65280.1 membrane protein [Sinomonas atrocyanea]GGG75971.1 membrane protein [Sinomonas atrocyanea]
MLDPTALLTGAGPWVLGVVALMVFIESGLLFPFLPGDSLLFTVGLLHAQLGLSLPVLMLVVAAAAVGGDQAGYLLGRFVGKRWFRADARVLKLSYLDSAEEFFGRYGGRALVLARFVPIVRTYVPLAAGMAHYPYRRFVGWNVLGGVAWSVSITLLGVWLGHVEFIAKNIDILSVLIVAASVIPIALEIWRRRRKAAQPDPAPVGAEQD